MFCFDFVNNMFYTVRDIIIRLLDTVAELGIKINKMKHTNIVTTLNFTLNKL